MKLSIAFLAVISSAAAAPVRMRTAERTLAEAVTTSIEEIASTDDVSTNDDVTGSMSMSVSMSYASDDVASDDVASAAGVSVGIAAGAAVLGAVALF